MVVGGPLHLWQKIADRYEIDIRKDIDPSLRDLGFWSWLCQHPEVPLCITEGAKKAGTLLSLGYAAVGLPGINSGYRTPKDEFGKRIGKSHLILPLQKLAVQDRDIYFVFDQDEKPNTVKAVKAAIRKTGYLFKHAGCQSKVVNWSSHLGKGVDDLVSSQGVECFEDIYRNAVSLETWQANSWRKLTYDSQQMVNSHYLSAVEIPDSAKLVGLKSPKGTGKTKLFETIVANARQNNKKILVIGHRVQLVRALCQRFGISYITEAKTSAEKLESGYGLCVDSLHTNSQAKFNPDDWSDSIVIIDEVEQVLWHGLNSVTCKDNRVEILQCLKTLLQNVLSSQGRVYVADADLSDIALDYLIALTGLNISPYIVSNQWKPDDADAWTIYNYPGKTPKQLVNDLETHIRAGGKPLVCVSAQKLSSKWGTQTLEVYFKQQFPQHKILRIDSESLADPNHPAYNCIVNLDRILLSYDLVLASPCLETGISIELKNHFTSVWAIAQGVQSENAVRQTLARLRCNVPRYLWCAGYSFQKIGNGSTSIPALINSSHRLTQLNIRLLQKSDLTSLDDIDTGFQAESLLCWAKMAVRYNATTINYRESILSALKEEGHTVLDSSKVEKPLTVDLPAPDASSLVDMISEIRQSNYDLDCLAIADAPLLTEKQYQNLKKRLVKTLQERHCLRKYELQQRYQIPINPVLVTLDDSSWYQKIRLHYFLTIGRPFLADRDAKVAQKLIAQGNGNLFFPDFNNSQLGAVVGVMELLGITVLLADKNRELRNTDADLQALAELALSHRQEIKTATGIGLAKNSSPVMIVRRFLEKIDCKLDYLRAESLAKGKKRVRVYKIRIPEDSRKQIFSQWIKTDCDRPGSSLFWDEDNFQLKSIDDQKTENDDSYLQLSLDW